MMNFDVTGPQQGRIFYIQHSSANLIPGELSFAYLILLFCDMQLKEVGF
jgi:hypothetical protein